MDSEEPMTHSFVRSRRPFTSRIAAVALLGAAALAGVACDRQPVAQAASPVALPIASNTGALPVAVNCGPGQQALIRPSLVNGQPISQVDCVQTAQVAAGWPTAAPMGVAYSPGGGALPVSTVGDLETVRVVERPVYRQAARPASYRTADYPQERRVVRSGRTWQKSALIIGSSAGVGAGVGAAVGGKKGALIGAAVGGGGATIWDQVTRRR